MLEAKRGREREGGTIESQHNKITRNTWLLLGEVPVEGGHREYRVWVEERKAERKVRPRVGRKEEEERVNRGVLRIGKTRGEKAEKSAE